MWKPGQRITSPINQAALREPTAPVSPIRVRLNEAGAVPTLARGILGHLQMSVPKPSAITFVCIGSDRSTGDALGPLVGTRLNEQIHHPGVNIRGTLDNPVHAANLSEHLDCLSRHGRDHLVVAIDACLGRSENVGTACVKAGPLRPGTGVNKNLPSVGHFHLVGVVNVGGFMEYFVLQNTRLNLVVRLADLIAEAITQSLDAYFSREGIPYVAAAFET